MSKDNKALISHAKRSGFIFQSSEIYGGFAAIYDYGHYGILLKDNIKNLWWKNMVLNREDIVGLDSAIFMHPTTWKASGHVDSFSDPQIDCRNCNNRMRADHILEKFDLDVDRWPIEEVNEKLQEFYDKDKIKCDKCGGTDLTPAKEFNLMVKSNVGSPTSKLKEEDVVYLRAETCQGIYLNYKNTIDSLRVKPPFGIAQVGKAFRNEIVARQYIFRTREFEQMEMQYFLPPELMDEKYKYWKKERMDWMLNGLALPQDKLRWKKHEKLAHYANAAFDIEYDFEVLGGFKELEGIHQRGDWDLSQHAKFSKTNLEYFDQAKKEKYIPHIMETSVGLNRLVLAILDNAYEEEKLDDNKTRVVLHLPKWLAPVKVAVLPLQKDEKLQAKAQEIYQELKKRWVCEYDVHGNIGKMYRRQDMIGTPFCVTVDFDSLEDQKVTVRDRDTMKQERVKIDQLEEYLSKQNLDYAG